MNVIQFIFKYTLKYILLNICHFCSCNTIQDEAYFMLECPIRVKFPSLFENIIQGSLKSLLDHQVGISLYLTEASTLCHSRELVSVKPSWCFFFVPLAFCGFPADFNIKFIALDFGNCLLHFVHMNYKDWNVEFWSKCKNIWVQRECSFFNQMIM